MDDLIYNGTQLSWKRLGFSFKATSGMKGYQTPDNQCIPDRGPVPEGVYQIQLVIGYPARDDGRGVCNLAPSWQIQTIPRGSNSGGCEQYWANWGMNRVRFEPSDSKTRNACSGKRSGFYLHDSTKGYSHGCIEIESRFFFWLRNYVKDNPKEKLLRLLIKYEGNKTYGETDK